MVCSFLDVWDQVAKKSAPLKIMWLHSFFHHKDRRV